MQTRHYRIHPGIGIARVGNHPSEYFIGPEAPGVVPPPPYRAGDGKVKRQGARFRVYEYTYQDGELSQLREVSNDADTCILWTVHLTNKKAAAPRFPPQLGSERNPDVKERNKLVINSGAQAICGAGQSKDLCGAFMDHLVQLGTLHTDEKGRLIVLGGFGKSQSVPAGKPLVNFANNPGWHDDTSDGPVTATVQIRENGQTRLFQAESAWVVATPPRFGLGLWNVVTWYDQALDVAIRLETSLHAEKVSFTRHIYPVLERVVHLQWVSQEVASGHSSNRPTGNFLNPQFLAKLADNSSANEEVRKQVFNRLVEPNNPASLGTMPQLNPGLDPADPQATIPASLTSTQYTQFKRWSEGRFEADWPGSPPQPTPLDQIKPAEQPAALDRAALEDCIGVAFHPGIECGYIMAQPSTYEKPFRISPRLSAGDLTAGLAVPWQADFRDCGILWWPAARPTEVYPQGSDDYVAWVPRGFSRQRMADEWWKLGFVIRKGDRYVETERELEH